MAKNTRGFKAESKGLGCRRKAQKAAALEGNQLNFVSTGWIGAPNARGAKGTIPYSMVQVNGRVFTVGDAVHLQSPNNMLPFVARITKLWEDEHTKKHLCECAWYFRPEDIDNDVLDTFVSSSSALSQTKNKVNIYCYVGTTTCDNRGGGVEGVKTPTSVSLNCRSFQQQQLSSRQHVPCFFNISIVYIYSRLGWCLCCHHRNTA